MIISALSNSTINSWNYSSQLIRKIYPCVPFIVGINRTVQAGYYYTNTYTTSTTSKLEYLSKHFFNSAQFSKIYSTLLGQSGLLQIIVGASYVGLLAIGGMCPWLILGATALMLLAQLAALLYYTKMYWDHRHSNSQEFNPHQIQALIGIASTLQYMIATFASAISFPISFVYFFTVTAASTGFLNVLYDWYQKAVRPKST